MVGASRHAKLGPGLRLAEKTATLDEPDALAYLGKCALSGDAPALMHVTSFYLHRSGSAVGAFVGSQWSHLMRIFDGWAQSAGARTSSQGPR